MLSVYLWSLLIGYLFGCFLTADVVCRVVVGRSAYDVGVGNPGMANVGHELGTRWALVVLAGDIAKTVVPYWICHALFGPSVEVTLLAGLGTTLGHNYPFWHGFRGGKGVTTTCSTIILASPVLGGLSAIAGFVVVVASGYLCLGAITIPVVFLLAEAVAGLRGMGLACVVALCVLMAIAHVPAALGIRDGSTPRAGIAAKARAILHVRR